MFRLNDAERHAFIAAASACLDKNADPLAAGKRLVATLAQFHATHKVLPTLRFRGHLFRVRLDAHRVIGATILNEADIVDIENV